MKWARFISGAASRVAGMLSPMAHWIRKVFPTATLARHLDRNPVRAVVVLDWLILGGGLS